LIPVGVKQWDGINGVAATMTDFRSVSGCVFGYWNLELRSMEWMGPVEKIEDLRTKK
jgi:hypothetical protein